MAPRPRGVTGLRLSAAPRPAHLRCPCGKGRARLRMGTGMGIGMGIGPGPAPAAPAPPGRPAPPRRQNASLPAAAAARRTDSQSATSLIIRGGRVSPRPIGAELIATPGGSGGRGGGAGGASERGSRSHLLTQPLAMAAATWRYRGDPDAERPAALGERGRAGGAGRVAGPARGWRPPPGLTGFLSRSALRQREAAAARLPELHRVPEPGHGASPEEAPQDPGEGPPRGRRVAVTSGYCGGSTQ